MAKGWTDERRAAYSRMMKARKAWAHSTGPRTAEGKKRASGNARGKGCRQRLDAELAPVAALMREWEVGWSVLGQAGRRWHNFSGPAKNAGKGSLNR